MYNYSTKKWFMSLFFLTFCTLLTWGQAMAQVQLRGKVTDEKGEELPGVTVLIKSTTTGIATGLDGTYQLTSPNKTGVLIFSFTGAITQEVAFNGAGEYNVQLKEDLKQLSEVVVVGYGTQKKVNLTGAVAVVSGEQLTTRQVASASLALQGSVPGVTVTQQSGAPGGDGGQIRIRGLGSIVAGSNPLVLIDNVEMSLDAIDPNNIESISVLKDAAAAAIYGSRAANGVVLVTTKRGVEGINVSYNAYVTSQEPTNLPKRVSAIDHMRYWDIAQVNSGMPAAFTQQIQQYEQNGADNFTRFDTDWKKLIMTNNGIMHNQNLNISGGTDRVKVYASGTFMNQNGLIENTSYRRYDMRFNTDVKITNKLTASLDLVMNESTKNSPSQRSPEAIIQRMIAYPAITPGRFDSGEWGEGWSNVNPAAEALIGGTTKGLTDSRITKGTLTYKPIEGLELMATYSNNKWSGRTKSLVNQYDIYTANIVNNSLSYVNSWPANNSISESISFGVNNLFRAQGTYSKSINDAHNFKVIAGFASEKTTSDDFYGSRINLLSTTRPYLNSGSASGVLPATGGFGEITMASIYGRINYDYKERYLLEINNRWDASSRFRSQNWWANFPSVSAGWRISEEEFWKNSNVSRIVDNLKLRGSYGSLGNQALNGYYPTYALFNTGTAYNYYIGNSVNSGYAITTAANENLKWETSKMGNIALDAGLWNNKMTVSFDVFQRDIIDMLQVISIPTSTGMSAPYRNVGRMTNKGWELAMTYRNQIKDFKYQVTGSFSDVKNTLIDNNNTPVISGSTIQQEGIAVNSYYGYKALGLFQTQEEINAAPTHWANTRPGDVRYADISGVDGTPDGKIDNYDRVVLGNSFPRYEYSANLSAQYKGFDLVAFFQGVGKRDNYLSGAGTQPFYSASYQGSMYEHQKDFWTPENTDAAYPRLTANSIVNNYHASSYWIKSAAYLRLKNVVLGYTLPKSLTDKIKIKSARVYVSGQNLITWDKFFPGFDPEQINTGGAFYPIMRTYSAGVNIKF